jgi:actin-related protein
LPGYNPNSGDNVSHIVPVYDECSLPQAIAPLDLADRGITSSFQEMFRERGRDLTTSIERPILRDIKEKLVCVAVHFEGELQKSATLAECHVSYTLPDDNEIVIASERFGCPELLFKPRLNKLEFDHIDQARFDSIVKYGIEIGKYIYANIVFSEDQSQRRLGGNARSGSGKAILASWDTFPRIGMTRKEYNDAGACIIHRKCF